jgi:hypothetical protein
MIVRFGRMPAFGHGASRFKNAHGAADVVRGARPPTIAMSADDHQLVRELAAAHHAERVVDRLEWFSGAIVLHGDAGADRAGTDVVVKG